MNIRPNTFYVYALVRPDTDVPFYIGKGVNQRVYAHFRKCIVKKESHTHKTRIIKKYIRQGYTKKDMCKILCYCETQKYAYDIETSLIENIGINNLSNVAGGGKGGWFGVKHTEKTKKKMSEAALKRPPKSEEERLSISKRTKGKKNPFYGKTHGDNHPKGMLGKKHSKETIEKLIGRTPWNKGKKQPSMSGEKNYFFGKSFVGKDSPVAKKIFCVTTGVCYNTLTEASEILNINLSCICAVCKGKQKTAGGYVFEYVK